MKCPECGEDGYNSKSQYLDKYGNRVPPDHIEQIYLGTIQQCKNGHRFGKSVKHHFDRR